MTLRFGLVWVALLWAGCAQSPVVLEPVPHPDTAGLDESLRAQAETRRRDLESLLDTAPRRSAGAARVMGEMGRFYHAYEFYEPAVVCYRNAALLAPEEFAWPYLLGLVHAATGESEEARQAFERALDFGAGYEAVRIRLGEVLVELGRFEAAREVLETALETPGFEAAARAGLGKLAAARNDSRSAVAEFQEALRLQPAATRLHYPLAMVHRKQGEERASRRHLALVGGGEVSYPDPLAEGIAELADTPSAHLRRGSRALAAGRPQAAVQAYSRAVAADPGLVEARRGLALALLEMEDTDAAQAELERARAREPDNVWVLFDLANVALEKGEPEAAREWLETALDLAPDFESARFSLANTLLRMELFDEARLHLDQILATNPAHTRARYQRAMVAERLGDREEAIASLRRLIEEEPQSVPAREGLASILILAGDLEAAVPELRQALRLRPESHRLHLDLAQSLEQTGRYREAAEAYQGAVGLKPVDRQTRLREVLAWVQAGAYRQARSRLEEGLAAQPDDAALQNMLARLLATCPEDEVRDGAQAVRLAQALYRRNPSLDHAETLGMALAEAGRFRQAVELQRTLMEQVANTPHQGHLPRLRKNLQRYEDRQPIRM